MELGGHKTLLYFFRRRSGEQRLLSTNQVGLRCSFLTFSFLGFFRGWRSVIVSAIIMSFFLRGFRCAVVIDFHTWIEAISEFSSSLLHSFL